MNAITVNYAEVDENHFPVSFGLAFSNKLNSEIIYNSEIVEIANTNYSILKGRDIGTTDIIVSSDSKNSRFVEQFTSGSSSWIPHRIPNVAQYSYIRYNNDDGYYYKMVENDEGKPEYKQYAPYAHLTDVINNDGVPYCEATIESPVELYASVENNTGKIKATINGNPVEVASISSTLKVQLENANEDSYNELTVSDPEYSIGDDFNSNSLEWTRDGRSVTPWHSGNKIVKAIETITDRIHQFKLLAGNNIAKIFRKRADYKVTFNFTNASFETLGIFCNAKEDSRYDYGTRTLTIPNVKYGRTSLQYSDFFTGSITGSNFNPEGLLSSSPFKGNSSNANVNIAANEVTDLVTFTGWIGDSLTTQTFTFPHNYINPTVDYTLDDINYTNINGFDIKENSSETSLLTWDSNNLLKRHRQVYHGKWVRTAGSTGSFESNCSQTIDKTIVDDSISIPSSANEYITIDGVQRYSVKEDYVYSPKNYEAKSFNVAAHYNSIPSVITDISDPVSKDKVIFYKDKYYVATDDMKALVKELTGVDTIVATSLIVYKPKADLYTEIDLNGLLNSGATYTASPEYESEWNESVKKTDIYIRGECSIKIETMLSTDQTLFNDYIDPKQTEQTEVELIFNGNTYPISRVGITIACIDNYSTVSYDIYLNSIIVKWGQNEGGTVTLNNSVLLKQGSLNKLNSTKLIFA